MRYKVNKTQGNYQQLTKHYMRFGLNIRHPISRLEKTWWPFIRWANSVTVCMDSYGTVYAATSDYPPDYRLDKKARRRLRGK
jgi:hypothetical protein